MASGCWGVLNPDAAMREGGRSPGARTHDMASCARCKRRPRKKRAPKRGGEWCPKMGHRSLLRWLPKMGCLLSGWCGSQDGPPRPDGLPHDGAVPSARKRPQDAATHKMGVGGGARCSGQGALRKMRGVLECCSDSSRVCFRGWSRSDRARPSLPCAMAFPRFATGLPSSAWRSDLATTTFTATSPSASSLAGLGLGSNPGQVGGQEVGLRQVEPPQGLHEGLGLPQGHHGHLQVGVRPRFASASLSMGNKFMDVRHRKQHVLQQGAGG